ncbi:acyltransferase family protein [Budvicia aquatica]|uniref:Uncharacterized protein conserved in bacteria n=1 Tax=Budvicia aquatica TaxID=82979 RepID=A0A2C6C0I1_9GAMM|nr:acyltransferase family protein [Budvicia aquatica]PHI29860.1 hypothetical protein CRN84_11150 [Budvicia aquatica]VFS48488.1 Uncharacterized protein conserved in bacteria [Budvicia aquatica]
MIRNVSKHALKSLSCFAAVTFFSTSQMSAYEDFLHVNSMSILYFFSVISKPLFFIIIGYMDEVEKLTRKETLIKVKTIIIIIIFWNIILSLIKTRFVQQGYLLQQGIILDMGLIYLFYPIIVKGIRNLKATALVLVGLVGVIALFDIFSPLDTRDDPLFISSFAFIWVWGGYYILGHALGTEQGRRFTRNASVHLLSKILLIPLGISMFFYERYISTHIHESVAVWFVLEHLYLLAMSMVLFILFDNMSMKSKLINNIVEFISPAMVGVYIVHYSVFYFITTLYDFHNFTLRFIPLALVFIASVMVSRLLLLNKYTAKIISF